MSAQQLTLIAETMILPKSGLAQFGEHGLSIAPSATEQDLLNIGHRLVACKGYLSWALGSLFVAMQEKRDGVPPKDREGKTDGGGMVSDFCEAQQIDSKLRRQMTAVYQFYRGAKKAPPLGYDWYLTALEGVGGKSLPAALAYLTHAHTHGLSVTQLRRHIRTTQATDHPEPKQLELANYGVVFEWRRFAARELPLLSTYTPERAALILSDIGDEALRYIDELRRIAHSNRMESFA